MYRAKIYARRIEQGRGYRKYIVTVLSGKRKGRDVAVSKVVFDLIGELERQDRHLTNQDERHSEYAPLSDETLYERALAKPRSVEDAIIERMVVEQVLDAIKGLPPLQAKRFVLRNILGLKYVEIARLEGCTPRAVKLSVDSATEKIRKIFNP